MYVFIILSPIPQLAKVLFGYLSINVLLGKLKIGHRYALFSETNVSKN